MVPNIDRGHSFRGVTAYLMHDKAQEGGPHPVTADRVGFAGLFNFVGDEAVSVEEASKVMALTVRDADQLKAAAGIKPGGRKAEKGPVWHASLSWDPSERPSDEEMVEAAHAMLDKVGLSLKSGYQTYIVQHTDTEHSHIHVVVNLVHPINGKQANPYRDLPKAQAWAHAYDKARGNVFCKDRAEKYDRPAPGSEEQNTAANTPGQGPKPKQDKRPRQTRPEWQARRQAGNDNRLAQGLAARLRTELTARYAKLEAAGNEAASRRRAESARFFTDLRAGRSAILQKYAEALDGVWKGRRPQVRPSPDRDAWTGLAAALNAREAVFMRNEGTLLGRLRNASILGRDLTPFRRARLAMNQTERRQLFEQRQRAYKDRNRPVQAAETASVPRPESKRAQSNRIKLLRAAELSQYDREMARQRAAMTGRHQAERATEAAARAELGRQASALWRKHREDYGRGSPGYPGRDPERRVRGLAADQRATGGRVLGEAAMDRIDAAKAAEQSPARVELTRTDHPSRSAAHPAVSGRYTHPDMPRPSGLELER